MYIYFYALAFVEIRLASSMPMKNGLGVQMPWPTSAELHHLNENQNGEEEKKNERA